MYNTDFGKKEGHYPSKSEEKRLLENVLKLTKRIRWAKDERKILKEFENLLRSKK